MENYFQRFPYSHAESELFRIASLTVIIALYTVTSRRIYHHFKALGLLLFWGTAVVAYGLGSWLVICSRGLTCDNGGPGAYLPDVAVPFGEIGALGFGAVTLFIVTLSNRSEQRRLSERQTALVVVCTLVVWLFASSFIWPF